MSRLNPPRQVPATPPKQPPRKVTPPPAKPPRSVPAPKVPASTDVASEHIEELVVIGRIRKPDVFYVLGRSATVEDAPLRAPSFVTQIPGTIKRNPF